MAGKAPKKAKKQVNRPYVDDPAERPQGLGPDSAGQSGDLQGLSEVAGADSESVEQLVEEGQALEAETISGVEDAPDADVKEVRVHQRPEDDVPDDYLDRESDI
jgi:hypothetical protein